MKHYTSIEQSTYLLSLGLDKNTADMWYDFANHVRIDKRDKNYNWAWIPCWSIGCLMSLMPIINIESQTYKWRFDIISLKYIETTNGEVLHNITCRGIFEKVYSMVVWLLENNYITK
jgi:hypothetical protein